ncbi:formate/nitrite transporter family protein [Persicobacter sp. CCB-QB2]|uniref:formate/nitrite transporter family protein n=1 Tax=Persicobacter sp. CCB-QB2 TaxID=1561025 RepID=UPI0006A963A5|nr:formate/nitrite transporter family protein [Persicobacter sp. CCB-QB2]
MNKKNRDNALIEKKDQPKPLDQILDEQIEMSLHEFNRSSIGLLLSAFSAGLEIGFSFLLMGLVYTMLGYDADPVTVKVFLALCYPLGFLFVILGRSELFTEHTALAMLPVLKKEVGIRQLFSLWGLVYAGNLVGGFLFSFIIVHYGPEIGFLDAWVFGEIAHHLVDYPMSTIFMSAIFAGWLMGLLGWLLTSSRDTISRIFIIFLITTVIGLAGFHHCIVGSIEVFSGVLSGAISLGHYFNFQISATFGNILGGAFFVSLLKYSHVRA